MNEISEKLRNNALKTTDALVTQLASEGKTPREIAATLKTYLDGKVADYYKSRPTRQNGSLQALVEKLNGNAQKEDSKAEAIFYEMLVNNGIAFQFQYHIGPYRVDYLIGEDLVFEIDGPMHDKQADAERDEYIKRMGYRILRVPVWVLANDLGAVIDAITGTLPLPV